MKMVRAPHVVGVNGRVARAIEPAVHGPAAGPAELEVALRTRHANAVRVEQTCGQSDSFSKNFIAGILQIVFTFILFEFI